MSDPWKGRGPWLAAGILGVLAAIFYLGPTRGARPRSSGSLTERGLFTTEPRAQTPTEPQTQVQDSFSMIEKGKDSASPAPPAKA
ncbi:MAG: hypothetical protein WC728_05945, partial [Elusimicrobiota bacterium]